VLKVCGCSKCVGACEVCESVKHQSSLLVQRQTSHFVQQQLPAAYIILTEADPPCTPDHQSTPPSQPSKESTEAEAETEAEVAKAWEPRSNHRIPAPQTVHVPALA